MSALLEAIKSRYDGDATLAAAPLWLGMAKEDLAYPYAVMHDHGGMRKYHYGGTSLKPARVQINGLFTSDTTAKTWQEALHDRITFGLELSVSGATRCTAKLVDDFVREAGKAGNGAVIYLATSIFEFHIEDAP
jgi:hypothetical protein